MEEIMSRVVKVAVLLGGLVLLALGGNDYSDASGETNPFTLLPERVFFYIAAQEAKFIEQALAKGTDKETIRAVKASAWRVAASAEVGLIYKGKFTEKFGSLATLGLHNIRHDAMLLHAAADKGEFERAKKLVAHLTPGYPKPNSSVKISTTSVAKAVPWRDVMVLFSSTKVGGSGVEALLNELAAKKDLTKADVHRLMVVGYKIVVLANLADHYTPEKDQGAKTAKAWRAYTADFRNASTEMAQAAAVGKTDETRSWLGKLTKTCKQCHDVFRK
jgi:cytochrome c'